MHGAMDLMHKKVAPQSYACKLCQITYSGAAMNKLWKQYVAGLDISTKFMHKNEFTKAYPDANIAFPAILLKDNETFKSLIGAADFKDISDLPDLMKTLNERMRNV